MLQCKYFAQVESNYVQRQTSIVGADQQSRAQISHRGIRACDTKNRIGFFFIGPDEILT